MNRYDIAQTNACNLTRRQLTDAKDSIDTALQHIGSDNAADALREALAALTTALRVNADITHDTVLHYADVSDECPKCSRTGTGPLCVTHDPDKLTQRLTSFSRFTELLTAPGGYRPTIHLSSDDAVALADAYDAAQAARGDDRRAYRRPTTR